LLDTGMVFSMIKMDMHLHSRFSDGENTPEEIILHAMRLGYHEIAITDHVRRTTNWLDEFVVEIERLKKLYGNKIKVSSGIEAKVIDLDGNLDAWPDFYRKIDFVFAAFHRIPVGVDKYMKSNEISSNGEAAFANWYKSFMKLLENENAVVIAHPTAILKISGIDVPYEQKVAIAEKAAMYGKIFEINSKYQVPDPILKRLLLDNDVRLLCGSDSHSIRELSERSHSISKCGIEISEVRWKKWTPKSGKIKDGGV